MTRTEILNALRNAKGPMTYEEVHPITGALKKSSMLYDLHDMVMFRNALIDPHPKSLASAIALVERVRPGEECVIRTGPKCCAGLIGSNADAKSGATPAIALLIALLSVEK